MSLSLPTSTYPLTEVNSLDVYMVHLKKAEEYKLNEVTPEYDFEIHQYAWR